MTKHHAYFNPYFASPEFQNSHERAVEVAIEKRVTSIWNKIWKRKSKKSKKTND